jgi:glycosyltransferase involved in cell wall biosynthesis
MEEGLIIIPAFNEEKNIGNVLENIFRLKLDIDVLVVDDGSSDFTAEVAGRYPVNVISHLYNLGYGAALQTGFKYAGLRGYKYIIQFDADGQHDSTDIQAMMDELRRCNCDIVIGSRFLGKGSFKTGILKKAVINFMRSLIWAFTKNVVTDPTSGFKGLSKKIYCFFSKMGNFPSDYPDADILIQMLLSGYKVREIPISVRQRESGRSMHSGLKPIIYLIKIMLSIFTILLRNRFMKGR